jgi:hypothetical protein
VLDDGNYSQIECNGTIKKIENDSLIINYITEEQIWGDGEDGKYQILKTIEKESFDVLYIYKDNQWHIANDEEFDKLWNTCFWVILNLK